MLRHRVGGEGDHGGRRPGLAGRGAGGAVGLGGPARRAARPGRRPRGRGAAPGWCPRPAPWPRHLPLKVSEP